MPESQLSKMKANYLKFRVILKYMLSSQPFWDIDGPVSNNKKISYQLMNVFVL